MTKALMDDLKKIVDYILQDDDEMDSFYDMLLDEGLPESFQVDMQDLLERFRDEMAPAVYPIADVDDYDEHDAIWNMRATMPEKFALAVGGNHIYPIALRLRNAIRNGEIPWTMPLEKHHDA